MLDFLITFGIMSLIMSMVIIFLLIMRGPMRRRFTAYCRYIIWAVVIIRLCIPVSFGFLPTLISVPMTERTETDVIIRDPSPAVSVPDNPVQIQPDTTVNDIVTELEPQTNTPEPQVITPTPDPTPEFKLTEDMVVKGIMAIWLIGAVGFIVVTLVKYRINIRKLTCDLTEPTAELNEIYLSVCSDMGLTRRPRLYINKASSSPMVCGFLRPRVLLPEIELSEDNLRYIIRHELIHYKRGDLWFKLLSMVANALHWFNPMVYIACGVFADETELSCDEKVLGKTELKARIDYGNSMLEIVRNCRIAPNLTTGFNPKKKAVKQRFENIIDTAKKRKGILIIISVIIVALIATSIIGCSDTRRYDAVPSLEYANGLANDDFRAYVFENKVFPVYGDKSSEEWKLFYEDEKLILIHPDGRCFEYGKDELEYPYVHEDPYYSADMTIYGDTGFLAYSVPPSEKDHGRACFVMIDTKNGRIGESYSVDALDIVTMHGGNIHDLSPFTSKWGEEYYFEWGVDTGFGEDSQNFYVTLNTTLGHLSCKADMDSGLSLGGSDFELGRYTADIEYLKELEGGSDEAYNILKTFMDGSFSITDAEALFEGISYQGYETLTFGDYLIDATAGAVRLNVEVTESEYGYIPVGKHSFVYLDDVSFSHSCDCGSDISENTDDSEHENREKGVFHVYKNQWRAESPTWKLYYDFDADTLVLEHSDGRRFAYGDGAEGVVTLKPAYKYRDGAWAVARTHGDYAVISYDALINEGEVLKMHPHLAVIDLTDGSVKATLTKTVDEILALHGLDRDFLIPFKDWNETGTLDYDCSFYSMGNEDSPTISLCTDLTFSGLTYSLDCITEFDKATGRLKETVTNEFYYEGVTPTQEWERKYALKPEDITRIEGVRNNDGAHLFSAFLKKDTAYLEEKAGYPKGTLDDYKTLRFGDHVFAEEKFGSSNDLLLYIEITESTIAGLEVGNHRFIYRNINGKEYLSHHCPHYTGYSYQTPGGSWLNYSNEPMLPKADGYTEDDFWAMMAMLRYNYHASKIEEFSDRAKTVFGVDPDLGGYTLETLYDGMERYEYRDEKNYSYSEVEYGDGYVVFQFYADYGYTVPAYKVRYNYHEIELTDDGRTSKEYVFDGPAIIFDIMDKEAIYTVG